MSVWSASVERSDDGALRVGDCDVRDLARDFGTPLYIYDEDHFRERARTFREAFTAAFAEYGAYVDVYYAGKSFLSSQVAQWMRDEGLGVDVASAGELAIALRGGVSPSRITLHGNNKAEDELRQALAIGVGTIVLDSFTEIEVVNELAGELGVQAPVLVRVITGVHAGGHEYIATSHEDQKFGISIATGDALAALLKCHDAENLQLKGVHSHIGSQILGIEAFAESARRVFVLRAEFAQKTGIDLPFMDIGGGYGVAYLPEDEAMDVPTAAAELAAAINQELQAAGQSWPHIGIEPGRAISGPSGMTLYQVGVIKDVTLDDGVRKYVAVDGGMSDNMRTITYGASYTAALASRMSNAEPVRSRVVGKHCESGDMVVRDVDLPADIARGDLVAVPVTGAYGRSLSNTYNAALRPAVIAVKDGQAKVLIRRDTLEDLLAVDIAPE